MSEKQKLTLSVNKVVIAKAKEMGINISEITENVLKHFAFSPTDLDDSEVYKQYMELFTMMLPTMKKYDFNVAIASEPIFDKETGDHLFSFHSELLPNSLFWDIENEESYSNIELIPVYSFDPPMRILSNFLEGLTSSFEKRKEHLKELEMAKQIIQAIAGTISSGNRGTHDRADR